MAKKDKKIVIRDKESQTSEIGRKFKQNPGLYIGSVFILVLVTVAFVGGDFLSGTGGGRGGDLTFGYYDKVPISFVPGNTFAQYRENARQNLQNRGYDINNFQIDYEIWRQAYEGTIVHTAILQMLKRSNYSVPGKTVDRQVAQLPQFQENGRFSAALYNRLSDSAQLNIWREVQDELNKSMFYSDYFYGLLTPSGEADFISNIGSVMRNFEMVIFNVDGFPDGEYINFANENSHLFNTIHLSMISTSSNERETMKILASIKDGTITFEDAARAQSVDNYADRGGDMGSRFFYELENEIPDAAHREMITNLGVGEISDVIKLADGWGFFRVESEMQEADIYETSVVERVRSYVRNFNRGLMEDWAITQANDFINEAKDVGFNNAARFRYLDRHSFGPVPINYGGIELFGSVESFKESFSAAGITDHDLQNLSRNENFWKTAFSAEMNTPSEPLVQGSNVLVFFPTEQINATEDALRSTAEMYTSYWLTRITEESVQHYFRRHPKMDDRFMDTYLRYFMP